MARYWFRQKTFGYGATANTWQGWVMTIGGMVLVIAIIVMGLGIKDYTMRLIVTLGGTLIVVVPLFVISYFKTEGGWRWRSR